RLSTASVLVACRFGNDGRTSVGIGMERLRTKASLCNTTTQTNQNGLVSRERADTGSTASRTRLTIGLTREFGNGSKLGFFYRYGAVTAEDRDRSRTLNGVARL